jgi:signal peptidase I
VIRAGALLVSGLLLAGCGLIPHYYRISSESMEPTLKKGTRVATYAFDEAKDLQRGRMIVFRLGGEKRISRLVGLPGDTVQMVDGKVLLNGKLVAQHPAGEGPAMQIDPTFPPQTTRMFREKFPDEAKSHRILDTGVMPADNTDVFHVPAGAVFALGDNRDDTADSRFPRESMMGAGYIPIGDITELVAEPS